MNKHVHLLLLCFHLGVTCLFSLSSNAQEALIRTCQDMKKNGLKTYRNVDWKKITLASADIKKYPYRLKMVFHVINHRGGFFSLDNGRISEKEINQQLKELRLGLRQCQIEVEVQNIYYWAAPSFLNAISRDPHDLHRLSFEEKCLLSPTHQAGAINVYMVDFGRSRALTDYWYTNNLTEDYKYLGSLFLTDYDRLSATTRWTTLSHETAHILLNAGHVSGGGYNVLSDDATALTTAYSKTQCQIARSGRFILNKKAQQ